MSSQPHILVVDDSPTQLRQLQVVLEQEGYVVSAASNGQDAYDAIKSDPPSLVITDLQMPEMNGLDLVAAVKQLTSNVPIILTTSQGSEEIAVEALQKGASSYVPKRDMLSSLIPTIEQVLAVVESDQSVREVGKLVVESSLEVCLSNDQSLVPNVISRLENELQELALFDEGDWMQIAMALDESMINAMVHGNLEVSSELRQCDDGKPYVDMIEKRQQEEPYAGRRVFVRLMATRTQASFTIRDQGPGFDRSRLLDPTDPENLEKAGGRGLLLINAFMDEVRHNDLGNEITMTKRKQASESST